MLTIEIAKPDHGRDHAMVFQDSTTSLTPHMKVGKQLAEVLMVHRGVNAKEARARVLELLSTPSPEMVAVIHGQAEDIEGFADELATMLKFPRDQVGIFLIGPSVGPHTGPGVYGAVILPKA